jgi:CDP-paratose 2-epimerase
MVSILITGAAGFVGSHAVEEFSKKGYEILGCDNLSRKRLLRKELIREDYNWNYIAKLPNVKLFKVDITNFEELKRLPKADIIIHCAAQVAVTTSIENPREDFMINALGTFNILELARLNDSLLIFTSTNKVYGDNVNKIPLKEGEKRYYIASSYYEKGINEEFPVDLTAHTPYGSSKLTGDIYVQDYAHTYGLRTYVLRMSCIYGERQFGVEDQGWVAWFVIATLTGKEITIYGNGKQVRDLLYVKDLVKLMEILINMKPKSDVFNVGGGLENSVSLLELLDKIESKTGKKPMIKFSSWRPFDQLFYISDISKINKITGWKPEHNVDKGLEKMINWVNSNIELFK